MHVRVKRLRARNIGNEWGKPSLVAHSRIIRAAEIFNRAFWAVKAISSIRKPFL